MHHKTNLLMAFLIALALHAGAAVCLDRLLSGRGEAGPDFLRGGYSVSLILPQSGTTFPEATKPTTAPIAAPMPPSVEPTPAAIPATEPKMQVAQAEPPMPTTAKQTSNETDTGERAAASTDDNAGTGEQGVETMYVGLSEIRPHYPLGSRMRGEEGVVSIAATVGYTGHASDVNVSQSSGYEALDQAAIDAVKKATFVASSASAKTGDKITMSFRFKLTD
jgi:protein TonB